MDAPDYLIRVTRAITIHENEFTEEFSRAAGPGGQHVNKVATAVRLRFPVRDSPSLPPLVRDRLLRLAGKRITAAGDLVIEARRFRSRERNRQDARQRLVALIRAAAERPATRHQTRPTRTARRRRLESKRRRGQLKRLRRAVDRQ